MKGPGGTTKKRESRGNPPSSLQKFAGLISVSKKTIGKPYKKEKNPITSGHNFPRRGKFRNLVPKKGEKANSRNENPEAKRP